MQSSDYLKSNEAYGFLDGDQPRPIATAHSTTRGAMYQDVTTPSVQSEADRQIEMTTNEAYGDSRINCDYDESKNAEEQCSYDYVLNL